MPNSEIPVVMGSFDNGGPGLLSKLAVIFSSLIKTHVAYLAIIPLTGIAVTSAVLLIPSSKSNHTSTQHKVVATTHANQTTSQKKASTPTKSTASTPPSTAAQSSTANKASTTSSKTTATSTGGTGSSTTSSGGGTSSSGGGGTSSGGGGTSAPAGYRSLVYWLAWSNGNTPSLPWADVNQVALFSLATCISAGNPESDCTGPASLDSILNSVPSDPSNFVNTVHQNNSLALITIGGSTNPDWEYPCESANVSTFAQNLVNYMQTYGFDGIDLDIEQDPTTGNPPLAASDLKACVEDVYNDAKAVKTKAGNTPLITSDVDPTTDFDIGQIEEPYIDQFNAMSYGASGSTLASEIQALETNSGIPASKILAGMDTNDYPPPQTDCSGTASYAASNNLMGVMLWFGQDSHANTCLSAVGPYL